MAILAEYHTATSVEDVLNLLRRHESKLAILAGGSHLVGALETRKRRDLDGVISLARLGLDDIRIENERVRIGAMTTLEQLNKIRDEAGAAGSLLSQAVRYEGPLNLRNQATIGGAIALAEVDSELYTALLALSARVSGWLLTGEKVTVHLSQKDEVAALSLIEAVDFPLPVDSTGHARVARSPMDRPIVAAVAVRTPDGDRSAICGVAPYPILAETPFDPPDDYLADAKYRLRVGPILLARARGQL